MKTLYSNVNEALQGEILVLRNCNWKIWPKSEYYSQNGQDWFPLDKNKVE